MANPQFILGGNRLILSKGVRYPIEAPRERMQAIDRTAAGTLQVESLGIGIHRRLVSLANLSSADHAALLNWFEDIANGAANAFTFIDEDGNSYTARWMNQWNFTEDKAGFSGTIELEYIAT